MSFVKNIKIIQILPIYFVIFLNNTSNAETITMQIPQYIATNNVQYNKTPQLPGNGIDLTNGYISANGIYNSTPFIQNNNSEQMKETNGTSFTAANGIYSITAPVQNNNVNGIYGNTTNMYSTGVLPQSINSNTNAQQYGNTNSRIYSKSRNKSCQEAYANSDGSYALDFSDTMDINIYGSSIIQDFCNKAKEKKYNFVYIDLCNTDVNPMLFAQWHQMLKQNNIQVMWNLSNNSSIDDSTIISLGSLDNIKGLNISNTNVSSYGITTLCNLLMNNTDSTIQFINICGIELDQAMKLNLINAFNQHIMRWKQKNNSKDYVVFRNAIIDSYSDISNYSTGLNTINTYINNGVNQNNGINYNINGITPYGNSSTTYNTVQSQLQVPQIGQQSYIPQLYAQQKQIQPSQTVMYPQLQI